MNKKTTTDFLRKLIVEHLQECQACDMQDGQPPQDATAIQVDPDGYEGAMAKSNLFNMAKNASELHNLIQDQENLEPWVEEKIAVAAQMLDSVTDHLMYQKASGKR